MDTSPNNTPEPTPEASPSVTTKTSKMWSLKEKFLDHSSQFGFELFMTLVSVLSTATFISYALYAICNYAQGLGAYQARFFGEAALWIAAAMIVWLPVTMIFYFRTQGHIDRHPEVRARSLYKVLTAIFLFFSIVTTIAFAFVTVFTLLRALISTDDSIMQVLLRVTLPSILSAVLFGWLSINWLRPAAMRRKLFGLTLGGISIVATLIILGISITSVRGAALDQKLEAALSDTFSAVQSYYIKNNRLPASLDQVSGISDKNKKQINNIEYIAEKGGRYQLCASFSTDTKQGEFASYSDDQYDSYGNFTSHDAGKQCFKLRASYYQTYNPPYEDYDTEEINPVRGTQLN